MDKIDIRDLRVGNLVYSSFSATPCKVTEIILHNSEFGVCKVTGVVGYKDVASLSPIPLSEEILIKNDYPKDEWHGSFPEDMNNKVVEFSEKPCKECQSYIDKGAFFVIGIDSEKSDDMSNPYRTGHLVGIKRESEFVKHLLEEYQKKDAIYMDYREMKQLGMIN